MTSHLTRIVVRAATLGGGLAAAYGLLHLMARPGDANIGAGLLVFALLILVCAAWGLLDGRRLPLGDVALCWAVVAGVFSLGWLVALSVVQADATMSWQQAMLADVVLAPFTFGMVVVPALVGAAIGQLARPAR